MINARLLKSEKLEGVLSAMQTCAEFIMFRMLGYPHGGALYQSVPNTDFELVSVCAWTWPGGIE